MKASAPPAFPIRIAEELILLMLNEKSGYLDIVPGWNFSCVMAGAVLADLALERRIETDLERLYLVDSAPTGDDLLDPTLEGIADSDEKSDAQFWIERNTGRADDIVATAFDRLVERDVLRQVDGGFFGLSRAVARTGRFPPIDTRKESRARILDVILDDDAIPDPRDAILVALMHTCGGFKLLLEPEEYEERLERIELISKLDLIGRTVAVAVKDSTAMPRTRQALAVKPIPRIGFLRILRERDFLAGNFTRGMHELYRKYGPVIRLPFRMRRSRVVALLGPEANRWVNRHGRFHLRTKDYIRDFEGVFGATNTLPGMDGADHYRMRRELQSSYSRATLAKRLPEVIEMGRRSLGRWKEGDVFPATQTLRNHVSGQISTLLLGVDCTEYADELLAFEKRALTTHVQGSLPKFMLATPRMKRYGKRVQQLREAILASHTPAQRRGKPPDFADRILEIHKNDPQFLPETDLTFPFVATVSAAFYLGNALSFAVYNMVRYPDVHQKIREEAESIFGGGREPEAEDFSHERIGATIRHCMECSRMYPVIPMQLRMVMNTCNVCGFQIPARTLLFVCATATHYSPDLFPDPLRFDIDRYLPERGEHLKPGAYAPYGLGTHACMGHRWLELQLAVNLLLIAYHLRLEVTPANYKLRIDPIPKAAPNKKLKLRVAEVVRPAA